MFISCGKGLIGDARVDGIVKDATTDEPIAGATVYLLQNEGGGIFGGSSSIVIDSTITQSDGTFEFKYDNDKDFSFYISAKADNYFFTMQGGTNL